MWDLMGGTILASTVDQSNGKKKFRVRAKYDLGPILQHAKLQK